jgi:hypothetical protein
LIKIRSIGLRLNFQMIYILLSEYILFEFFGNIIEFYLNIGDLFPQYVPKPNYRRVDAVFTSPKRADLQVRRVAPGPNAGDGQMGLISAYKTLRRISGQIAVDGDGAMPIGGDGCGGWLPLWGIRRRAQIVSANVLGMVHLDDVWETGAIGEIASHRID